MMGAVALASWMYVVVDGGPIVELYLTVGYLAISTVVSGTLVFKGLKRGRKLYALTSLQLILVVAFRWPSIFSGSLDMATVFGIGATVVFAAVGAVMMFAPSVNEFLAWQTEQVNRQEEALEQFFERFETDLVTHSVVCPWCDAEVVRTEHLTCPDCDRPM